jgi:hypothetical protein
VNGRQQPIEISERSNDGVDAATIFYTYPKSAIGDVKIGESQIASTPSSTRPGWDFTGRMSNSAIRGVQGN